MIKAGIEHPESQEGREFCTEKCPYDYCIVFEQDGRSAVSQAQATRMTQAIVMHNSGASVQDIAKKLKISVRTVQRYLE